MSSWLFWTGIAASPVLLAVSPSEQSEQVLTHINPPKSPEFLWMNSWTERAKGVSSWNLRDGEGIETSCPDHDLHIPGLINRMIFLTFHLSCPSWPFNLPIYALTHCQKLSGTVHPSDYTGLPGDIRRWRELTMSFAHSYCPCCSKCVYQPWCSLAGYRFYLFLHLVCFRQYRERSKRQQDASYHKTKRSHCYTQWP